MIAAAAAVFALATLGLVLLVEPVPTFYYHLAWWSYIAFADGLNRRLSGRSLLLDRPRRFAWLAGVSVLWWTLFELINVRLGNWYYVMSIPWRPLRWAAGAAAFATVLPGIVVTLELVENRGWLRTVPVRPLLWTRGKELSVLVLGLLCLVLPLLWPDLFFPLTWGSFVFLLEPWNRRHARRSFLRDLEAGEAGPFCRTLLAGLVCGGLWEAWNFWARTRWIYTVPGFEGMKVFEMPLTGFLGFPPFAVECLVLLRFLGGVADRLPARGRSASRALGLLLGPPAVVALFAVADRLAVDSVYVPVAGLDVIPAGVRAHLVEASLASPERLLRATARRQEGAEVAARAGLSRAEVEQARARAALVVHRGLGLHRARQMEALGIRTLDDLALWPPDELARELARLSPSDPRNRFLERRARVWTRGLEARGPAGP